MKAIIFVLVCLVASPALAQGFVQGSFNPNAFGGGSAPLKIPKKFLPKTGTGTAGKLKISIASVSVGPAVEGQEDRLLVTFNVKNTDPKKSLKVGSILPDARDETKRAYNAASVAAPDEVGSGKETQLLVAIALPDKNAKSLKLVIADHLGWEFKRSDWEKTP